MTRHSSGAKFGTSGFGSPVVIHDPFDEQYGYLRLFMALLILLYAIISLVWLYFLKKKLKQNLTDQKAMLILLFGLSVGVSGFHFADNLMRPVDYWTPEWIHRGLATVQDITCIYWLGNNTLGLYALYHLAWGRLEKKYTYMMYLYCFAIWSGQSHFIVAPIWDFHWFCIATILGEGFTSIALHIYMYFFYSRESPRTFDRQGNDGMPKKSKKLKKSDTNENEPEPVVVENSQEIESLLADYQKEKNKQGDVKSGSTTPKMRHVQKLE
ncbi:hypothetical protein RFI_06359 [Reticulomyxa filosa]|uniref:Uncharacterized protein n=1 Tax=Reticulomyxa filosa TaxID=46433 RepID=X6NZN8_RETFI|nr:hypothetical protein RFI_06359 [Reticulomyxa filosa]|eukprot:ETO30762.1 hypothetical protein RFI_06359 [Reticulomyxa filosa]